MGDHGCRDVDLHLAAVASSAKWTAGSGYTLHDPTDSNNLSKETHTNTHQHTQEEQKQANNKQSYSTQQREVLMME